MPDYHLLVDEIPTASEMMSPFQIEVFLQKQAEDESKYLMTGFRQLEFLLHYGLLKWRWNAIFFLVSMEQFWNNVTELRK